MNNINLDEEHEKLIYKIINLNKEGLEFLKKSDEIDYEKKIKEVGIYFVSAKEVCFIHHNLGFSKDALIHPQLLESSTQRPINCFLYNNKISIITLASELCFSLVDNRPFIDGNKRVGLITLCYFFEKNNIQYSYDTLELSNYILSLAQHRITTKDLNDFLVLKIENSITQTFIKY